MKLCPCGCGREVVILDRRHGGKKKYATYECSKRAYARQHAAERHDVNWVDTAYEAQFRRFVQVLRSEPELEIWQLAERFGLSRTAASAWKEKATHQEVSQCA